jgi:hypothetical protein
MNALLIPIVIQTTGHSDDEMMQFLVGMATVIWSTCHIIVVTKFLNSEGYTMPSLIEERKSPRIGDFRQADQPTTGISSYLSPLLRSCTSFLCQNRGICRNMSPFGLSHEVSNRAYS